MSEEKIDLKKFGKNVNGIIFPLIILLAIIGGFVLGNSGIFRFNKKSETNDVRKSVAYCEKTVYQINIAGTEPAEYEWIASYKFKDFESCAQFVLDLKSYFDFITSDNVSTDIVLPENSSEE